MVVIAIIGVLIALLFLLSGYGKAKNFSGTEEYMASFGLPAASILLVIALILEIGGALMVLLGYKAEIGALLLIIFTVPASLVFHTNFADQAQMTQFLKNLSILGGLVFVYIYGSGPYSLDRKK